MRELRELRKLSREQLAARMNCTPDYLARIEQGSKNLTILSLAKLASALQYDIVDLLAPPDDMSPRGPGRPRAKTQAG